MLQSLAFKILIDHVDCYLYELKVDGSIKKRTAVTKPKWLEWAAELQSIAQAGLTFSKDRYDLDRYEQIRELSVEILQHYTEAGTEKIRTIFASETGYQTPKVDVRSAVFRDNKILLIKEKLDGRWALPGGWADVNTTPGESAVKECMEEAGARVVPGRIIAIHLANKRNDPLLPFTIYKIIIECKLEKIVFTDNTETSEAEFFSIGELPELSTGRTTKEQIELCFKASREKYFEPIFD
jgi:ADP-ribose pyrophosphatase YjhB (NUDIX family)